MSASGEQSGAGAKPIESTVQPETVKHHGNPQRQSATVPANFPKQEPPETAAWRGAYFGRILHRPAQCLGGWLFQPRPNRSRRSPVLLRGRERPTACRFRRRRRHGPDTLGNHHQKCRLGLPAGNDPHLPQWRRAAGLKGVCVLQTLLLTKSRCLRRRPFTVRPHSSRHQ